MITPHRLSPVVSTAAGRGAPSRVSSIEAASSELATRQEPDDTNHSDPIVAAAPETILRFLLAERLLHWAIAIPFLGCFLSALVLLLVFNHNPNAAHRSVFAWMHRGCGAGLILCPSLVLLVSGREARIHLYNVRQAWVWRLDDIKWLALMGPAALFRRIALPDQGKFNAAEKLNFMMVMVFPPLFIATGLLIWFPDATAFGAFGAWLIHCALAAVATPLVIGHILMATVNPGTRVGLRGMISGFVSREWAAHHYARWFREQFPDPADQPADAPATDPLGQAANAADGLPLAAARIAPVAATAAQPLPGFEEHAQAGSSVVGDAMPDAARAPSLPALAAQYSSTDCRRE